MKIKALFLRTTLLILLLIGNLTLLAQRNSGGGAVSNEQLLQFMKQGQSAGLSETEIMQMLQQQGYSAAEITVLKQRMAALQNTTRGGGLGTEIRRADTAKFARDSTWVKEVPRLKKMPEKKETSRERELTFSGL